MENQNEEQNIESLKSFILENKEYDPIKERERIEYEILDNDDHAQNILTDEIKRIEDRKEKMGQNPDNEGADPNWEDYWNGFNSIKYKRKDYIENCPPLTFKEDVLKYYAEGIKDARLKPFLKKKLEEKNRQAALIELQDETVSDNLLANYFDDDCFKYYQEKIEKKFLSQKERGKKWLTLQSDGQLKWTGKKEILVAVINLLLERGYFLKKYHRLKLRKAFEMAYHINLQQSDKPSDHLKINKTYYREVLAFIIPVSAIPPKLITKK